MISVADGKLSDVRRRLKRLWASERGVASRVAGALVMLLAIGQAPTAAARSECALPAAFAIRVEQRSDGAGARGLFASTVQPPAAPLIVGDAIRQANGAQVESCADLERVAVEAMTKGLALLLGVERGGSLTAVAVVAQPPRDRLATAAEPRNESTPYPHPRPEPLSESRSTIASEGQIPRGGSPGMPSTSPRSTGELELPPPKESSVLLRACAAQTAQDLRLLDQVAQLSVPLVAYDRRLHDTTGALAKVECGSDQPATIMRAFITDTLGYYRTASDIRHFSADFQRRREVDVRSGAAGTMPYFADSAVTAWVAAYPFLRASLLESPRPTRFLEAAGSWSPDRAVELLWEHARQRVTRLAEWAATSG